jgi:phenylalanyl-tRNA synthetase beta chain
MTGRAKPENWNTSDKQVDFYNLMGYLEELFNKLVITREQWKIEPYQSGQIDNGLQGSFHGKSIFIIGSLNHQVLKTSDCRQPVFFAEINWDLLFSLISDKSLQYKGIPKFPEVRRDIALLVDDEITFAQIEKLAFQTEKKLLKKIGLFDVYEGEKIAPGKKSYAMNLILQDEDKTLTDKEIEKSMDKLLRAMVSAFNAQLR